MPTRPLRACARPGCPARVSGGYCPACARPTGWSAPGRASAVERGYDWSWHKLRTRILRDEPLCRPCRLRGVLTAAVEVDHIVPLCDGGTHDHDNLRPICRRCHQAKTTRDRYRGRKGPDAFTGQRP
jgi:5-methylcytosine-specific restriction protein A